MSEDANTRAEKNLARFATHTTINILRKIGTFPVIITYEPQGRRAEARLGDTLLEVALRVGVGIRTDCGGKGTCGKCRVVVNSSDYLNDLSPCEREHLTSREVSSKYRLACQASIARAEGKIIVNIPPESKVEARRFQVAGIERPVELKPAIRKVRIDLREPTLRDPMPDAERLLAELRKRSLLSEAEIDLETLRQMSEVMRDAGWQVSVVLWRNEKIICVERKDTTDRLYGFAVDIGTSKIVGNLVDLRSGETLFVNAVENPQLPYGEDVMSRIAYSSIGKETLEQMSSLVRQAINKLLEEACLESEASVRPEEVYEMAIAGNTVMHHLFLSIPPFYLSQAPYVPTLKRPMDIPSRELGMRANSGSNLYVLPVIAGFVGADAVADIIATGIHRTRKMSLLIDIGTNTEVVLGNKEELLCCSCASGPAFEGMHLRHGMKAVSGAIERIEMPSGGDDVVYETIDGEKAIGICGSGIIDAIASLFNQGTINKRGYFVNPTSERFISGDRGTEFLIAKRDSTAGGMNLTVSEEDILAILLAKAAVATGCRILMKRKGIVEKDIDQVLIAGAFGNHLNIANAKAIGLIPEVPLEKIALVGNTSISGAKMCLLSTRLRAEALSLSKKVKYVELAAEPGFAKEFSYSL